MGVGVLAVGLGAAAILDGEPGAAVQAAQAHHAAFLAPDGSAVLHFEGLDRAFFRAQAAADAGVLHPEVRGAADPAVIDGLGDPPGQKGRSARAHVPVGAALEDGAEEGIDLFFGVFGEFLDFFRGGKVKDRRPGVGHSHGKIGVDAPAADGPVGQRADGPGVVP